jgi:methyl-accepting chemotaxis protein
VTAFAEFDHSAADRLSSALRACDESAAARARADLLGDAAIDLEREGVRLRNTADRLDTHIAAIETRLASSAAEVRDAVAAIRAGARELAENMRRAADRMLAIARAATLPTSPLPAHAPGDPAGGTAS